MNNVDLTNLSLVMASRRGQSNWRRRGRGAWSEVAPVASATRGGGGGGGGARRGRRRGVPSRRGAEGSRSQSRGRREEQLAQLEELKHLIAATEDQLNVTLEEAMMPQHHAQHDLHCRRTSCFILLPHLQAFQHRNQRLSDDLVTALKDQRGLQVIIHTPSIHRTTAQLAVNHSTIYSPSGCL